MLGLLSSDSGSGQGCMVQNSTRRVFGSIVRRGNARFKSEVRRLPLLRGMQAYAWPSFIDREDDELAEAKQERRPGRPPTKTEERISQRKEAEEREFRGGFWVPELRDEESRLKVERWGGEWGGLNTLGFIRVVKAGLIKPSSFPPKANS